MNMLSPSSKMPVEIDGALVATALDLDVDRFRELMDGQKIDLLLLFMYLEMISMVETYWRMGKLPVRMPMYIAMVGIARHLMVDSAYRSPWLMIAGAGSIVLLALGVLIVRYGHLRFPYESNDRRADTYAHE